MNLPAILMITDNIGSLLRLEENLMNKGFAVHTITSLGAAQKAIPGNVKAVIWDVKSPEKFIDASFVTLLSCHHVVKLMLCETSDIRTKVTCYQAGIDIVLAKPVEPEEVSCVIANLTGKLSKLCQKTVDTGQASTWTLRSHDSNLQTPAHHHITLTQKERRFLAELMLADNLTVSKERLLKKLGYEAKGLHGRKALDVMVTRLRKKIKNTTGTNAPIKTIYQEGFQFDAAHAVE